MQKILVTEDSQTILDMVKDLLEGEGYSVITAMDGQEAFNKAKSEKPDLIILDLMLPKLDGYKVCRMLKFDDNYKHIPIVIFTARASEADRKMGGDVAADAYITKPFQPEELLSKVRDLIST